MKPNDLQAKMARLETGDHLCLIYDTDEEYREILASYIFQGLKKKEKVIYAAEKRKASAIESYLKERIPGVGRYLENKDLLILPSSSYLHEGRFNPDSIIQILKDKMERALSEGYSALRVTGDLSWVLKKKTLWKSVMEYETKLNTFFPGSKAIALCQYDRREFSGKALIDVLSTHPKAILGSDVMENIYYMPPEELTSKQLADFRFNRRIEVLKELKQAKNELSEKEQEISRIEKDFRESERYNMTLADSETRLIIAFNTRMKADYCNLPWRLFTGRASKEEKGDGWLENMHPDDIAGSREAIRNAFESRENFNFLCRIKRKDGIYRSLQINASPRFNRNGRFTGYTGYCIDVTAGEQLGFMNRLLETIKEINHFIFNTINLDEETLLNKVCGILHETGIYSLVAAGKIKRNPDMIVFTAREGMGAESIKEIPINPEDAGYSEIPVLEAVRKRKPVAWENTRNRFEIPSCPVSNRKSEKIFAYLGLPILIHDDVAGIMILCSENQNAFSEQEKNLLVDLSENVALAWTMALLEYERKNLIQQLVRSEKLAAVGELIAGVAHEINNPLTGIMGISELMLLEDKIKLDDETRKDLENIHNASHRVYKIVTNLLRFARREEPMRKNISVTEVMDSVLKMRDYELTTRNIKYVHDYQQGIPNIMADPSQLEQVFLNIINNAEYAMREKGKSGVLTVNIFKDGRKKGGQRVVIEIFDTGPGIPEDVISKLFDPFFTTKPVGKGTGLGLSVSYGIIKEHGGEIYAGNKKEGGALFTIKLPVLEETDGE